ncbi:hypothetical protein SAMN06272771_6830 [Streptomyces sp. Ag82_O1-12]|nr:hypothetical protein SAMN06272771_6830 [Streptomyces sp. Ag82_O1-12]SOD49360.1 hypothetical protein SAMN06272727_6836 [Streptomyces sp. Ag82_G6-1]
MRLTRRRRLHGAGLGVGLVVLTAAGTGWAVYAKLDGTITSDDAAAADIA